MASEKVFIVHTQSQGQDGSSGFIPLHSDTWTHSTQSQNQTRVPPPLPKEFYDQFLSTASRRAAPNAIRELESFEKNPGILTLLAGKPNISTFPMTSLNFSIRSPTPSVPKDENSQTQTQDQDQGQILNLTLTGPKMEQALQYGPTTGIPSLVSWLSGLQTVFHNRRAGASIGKQGQDGEGGGEGWRLVIGNGSQDVLYKAAHAILNPGDYVLLESPVYAPFIPVLERLGCNIVAIDTDSQGIKPSSLKSVLENWPEERPRPKVLYTVPFGCNPSGATTSSDRRREILNLARKYNFLIFEDDPYYYLYFGDSPRPPTYFSLELEQPELGRVIRFDSLSKIVSSGFRIGFASGPTPIMDAIDSHTSVSNLQASTLTQVITDTMFRAWGYDGFNAHITNVAGFYRARKETFERHMREYLEGLAEWTSPDTGMFFWVKLLVKPPSSNDGAKEVGDDVDSQTILPIAVENGIVPLPGAAFMPDRRKTPYIRLSYSQLAEDQVEEAVRRLAEMVREARKKYSGVV